MTGQLAMFDAPALSPSQQEVIEALRAHTGPATTADLEDVIRAHGIPRQRNCIAKRLTELERMGLVERCGWEYGRVKRTTWRQTR